ncbi:MAG: type IV pilus modification protein PilV [Methylomicrobium sp.]
MPVYTYRSRESGFTLLEVLISMIILAIGLLGMAGLQATALRNNKSAYYRTQATQLAYDIADRMRANWVEAEKLDASAYQTIPPSDATAKPNCLSTTGCTSIDMAENDLFEWNAAIAGILPLGEGSIDLAGSVYTVTIRWDDNREGDSGGSLDASDPSFSMSFRL